MELFQTFGRITAAVLLLGTVSAGRAGESGSSMNGLKVTLTKKYAGVNPSALSAWSSGVVRGIKTDERIIALTFDACGGPGGNGYDAALINYLEQTETPATLFISGRWIDANPALFKQLSVKRLFDIQNHGLKHRPLSINGASIYGIKGTRSISDVVEEVEGNAVKIASITGKRPVLFRSGTACYDDVSIKIVNEIGYRIINYRISPGDAEHGKSAALLARNLLREASPGAVVLMHMNHPGRNTNEAVRLAVPELKKRGYSFVKLADYAERLIER